MVTNVNNNKILIISSFLGNLENEIYPRKIERATHLNIRTVLKELKALVSANVLDYKRVGKTDVYFLKQSVEAVFLVVMAEVYKSLEFVERHKLLRDNLKELSEWADFVIFGSYASGNEKENSDMDMVIFSSKTRKIQKVLSGFNAELHPHFIGFDAFKKKLEAKDSLAVEIIKNHVCFGRYKTVSQLVLGWIR